MIKEAKVPAHIWAIKPEALEALFALYKTGEINKEAGMFAARSNRSAGAIGVLPIYGTISNRGEGGLMELLFGGANTQSLSESFRQMVRDPKVSTIVLDIDSPGGSVFGVQELSDEIFKARGTKKIIAVASGMAASAAYWIATAADELVVSPSSEVGSIGVFATHQDVSKEAEMMGIKVTLISAGKYKVEGNPFEPLSDEAKKAIQDRVDDYYSAFVGSVARNRGVSVSVVKADFGQGRIVGAKDAVKLGMADRVGTLQAVLEKLGASLPGGASGSASSDAVRIEQPNENSELVGSDDDTRVRRQRFLGR